MLLSEMYWGWTHIFCFRHFLLNENIFYRRLKKQHTDGASNNQGAGYGFAAFEGNRLGESGLMKQNCML